MKNIFLQDATLEIIGFNNVILLYIYIFIPFFLLGIILLASIGQILDTEADFQQRKLLKPEKPTIVVDLTYIILPNPIGIDYKLFVYDKLDPSGLRMFNLFSGRGNDIGSSNGVYGFTNYTRRQLNANRELPMVASPIKILFIEESGGAILSNGLVIGKEVVGQGVTTTNTRLLVRQS